MTSIKLWGGIENNSSDPRNTRTDWGIMDGDLPPSDGADLVRWATDGGWVYVHPL